MSPKKKPIPGTEPVRTFPYYKIQVWEERRSVWMDIQKKFLSIDDLRAHARQNFDGSAKARVVVVEGYGLRHIDESLNPFGD